MSDGNRDGDEWLIRRLIERWAVWRDAGDWERFATLWHPEAHMSATWFAGTAADFIAASRSGFEAGIRILHFLGGMSVDVEGRRAVAQTKMTIAQRATIDDVEVEVVCTGRFYDFLERRGDWRIVRRQPIYESDFLRTVDPGASFHVPQDALTRFPYGYRYLGFLQSQLGLAVRQGLPELTGSAVEQLYVEGAEWLAGQ